MLVTLKKKDGSVIFFDEEATEITISLEHQIETFSDLARDLKQFKKIGEIGFFLPGWPDSESELSLVGSTIEGTRFERFFKAERF